MYLASIILLLYNKREYLIKPTIMKFLNLHRLTFIFSISLVLYSLFYYNSRNDLAQIIENKFMEFITPVMKISSSELYNLNSIKKKIELFFKAPEEVKNLEEKNQNLEKYYYLYIQTEAENKRLRDEINFTKNIKHKYISAQIIGRPTNSGIQQIIIDVGLDKDIKKGDFILAKNQLIGRVIEIFSKSARVLLLSDIKSKIPAIAVDTRAKFIVEGQATKYFACKYLNERLDLKEEELVTTSAEDVNIPGGIIIGSIFKEEDSFFIKQNVNLDKIEFVQVLLSEND